jgi:hypothetical protein
MFGGIKRRAYREKVLGHIDRELERHLGKAGGEECLAAFITAVQKSDMPPDLLEQFRQAGLTVSEAAVAYFDASITATKRVLPSSPSAEVERLLANMEDGLDKMFLAAPSKIVPRNGKSGEAMASFTKDFPG